MFSGFLMMGIMGYECMQLIADMCVNLQSLKDSLGDGMQQISNKKVTFLLTLARARGIFRVSTVSPVAVPLSR
jgi:hypothetical protein